MGDEPRYGGVNGGPLISEVTSSIERMIREAIDRFDSVYFSGRKNWLLRQRTGRLCEDLMRVVANAEGLLEERDALRAENNTLRAALAAAQRERDAARAIIKHALGA